MALLHAPLCVVVSLVSPLESAAALNLALMFARGQADLSPAPRAASTTRLSHARPRVGLRGISSPSPPCSHDLSSARERPSHVPRSRVRQERLRGKPVLPQFGAGARDSRRERWARPSADRSPVLAPFSLNFLARPHLSAERPSAFPTHPLRLSMPVSLQQLPRCH